MKRPLWSVVAGLVAGAAAGYGLAVLVSIEAPAAGSAFLREFSFEEALQGAAEAEWEILHDRTETLRLGRSRRISRRFVARATLARGEVAEFARRFDEAVETALPRQSGEARVDLARATPDSSTLVQLPRYHYRVETGEGIVDAGIIAENGAVTVTVSMLE